MHYFLMSPIQGFNDKDNIIALELKFIEDIIGKTLISILDDLNLNSINYLSMVFSVFTFALHGAVQKVQTYASPDVH